MGLCVGCGSEFESGRRDKVYCGDRCRDNAKKRRRYYRDDAYRATKVPPVVCHGGCGSFDTANGWCSPCRESADPYVRARQRASAVRAARVKAATVERVDRTGVFDRDGWMCHLCGDPVDRNAAAPDPLSPTLDHIVPVSKGGEHSYANVALAHLRCNVKKGARLLGDRAARA